MFTIITPESSYVLLERRLTLMDTELDLVLAEGVGRDTR